MPIPPFDSILNTLPPHVGDPRQPMDLSPYGCSIEELSERFCTSPRRKSILEGFLELRGELLATGMQGCQWVDGKRARKVLETKP